MPANRRYLIWFLALVGSVVGLFWIAQFYTDWLWYRSDAYPIVFTRRVGTKLLLFAVTSVASWAYLKWHAAHALRALNVGPRAIDDPDDTMEPELRAWLDSMVRPLGRWLPLAVGLFAGMAAAEGWQLWLLVFYGQPFGQVDPQFQLDAGFYIYRLGAWRTALSGLVSLSVVATVVACGGYLYTRQIRISENEVRFERQARGHLLALTAFIMVLRAGLLWVHRYELVIAQKALFPGAGWAEVHVTMPALVASALLALAAGGVCLWVRRPGRTARPAYYAIGIHLVVWVLLAAFLPKVFQRVVVNPNQIDRESPYIERAIAATRQAFGLDNVVERSFRATNKINAGDLAQNPGTVENIRVWDDRPLLRTYAQLQEIRQYYDIIDVDSDRYQLGGRLQQVLISAREMNHDKLDPKAKSWINLHLEYTHGYGVVVSSANRIGAEGQPAFLVQDIPPQSKVGLNVTEPRIYFGEVILMPVEEARQQQMLVPGQQQPQQPERPDETAERIRRRLNSLREGDDYDYLVVGADRDEFDYAETAGDDEVKHRTRYDGKSGIPLGGFLRRVMLGMRLHSIELMVSSQLNAKSKLLLHRQVTRRCQKAAPFLQWDTNPYPVVVDGRVYFICEGYTLSQRYPYSETHYERERTPRGWRYVPTWNYLRNSVKGVVDAYNGTVSLYWVDPNDPLAKTYDRIYPGMLKPAAEIPPELQAHFRYPMLLFRTQADMYRRYHMTDPVTFYSQEDLWDVAREVDNEVELDAQAKGIDPKASDLYRDMQPYYITMSLPGEHDVQFMLLTPFTPSSTRAAEGSGNDRDNMIAWMVAACDPDQYGRLVVYQFPKDTNIYGPLQVNARIDQDDAISQQLTLWDRAGSQVIRGNLLVVPIESSLLYVQALYLESSQKGLPELKRVVVVFGDKVVMEPTLAAALERLFGRVSMTSSVARPEAAETAPTTTTASGRTGVDPRLIEQTQRALQAADEALRQGDWSGYAREWQRLREAVDKLRATEAAEPKAE